MATITTQINLGSRTFNILSITLAKPWQVIAANGFQFALQTVPPILVAYG